MIQDIFPSRMDITYQHKQVQDDSPVMVFQGGKLLSKIEQPAESARDDGMAFPRYQQIAGQATAAGGAPQAWYLFRVDGEDFFLCLENIPAPEGYAYQSMMELRRRSDAPLVRLMEAFTACHLSVWYESSRFCGKCGCPMRHDTVERAMVCPDCQAKVYPRINPAVIVGVTNGDRILITKYRTGYGHSALVAGFVEIGETLEDTVRREVMEETGVKVKNIRYYKSQPWGIALDLLAGFFCEVDGDDTIRMDQGELKYAEWVRRDQIELQPDNISLTNEMMTMFKTNRI